MSAFSDAAKARTTSAAFFGEVLAHEPLRAWTGYLPITVAGRQWKPVGTLGGFGAARQTPDFEATTFNIGIHAARTEIGQAYSSIVAAMQAERARAEYTGAPVRIFIGFFDRATGTFPAGLRYYAGGVGSHILTSFEPGKATQRLQVEKRTAPAMKARASYLTDADQQRLFPGDLGLQFLSELLDGQLVLWDPVA